jgi:hypothetical protein
LNRRQLLRGLGGGAVGALLSPGLVRAWPAAAPPGHLGELTQVKALAERVRRASREGAFDVAVSAIEAGATPATLIGAAFLTGIQEIRPRSVGGKLHAVMMVESAFQLIEKVSPQEAWLAALWTLDDCKRSQDRDVRESGDWTLPPRPKVAFSSAAHARRELLAALESWDADRADRALVGLLAFGASAASLGDLFEILRPVAARSYTDIGHKIIFCTQVERALARLGAEHREPALRSLVNGLLYEDRRGRRTEAYDRAQSLVKKFPAEWMRGKESPGESLGLLRRLRGTTSAQAQALVVSAFQAGLGPATVWDGLRLYAAEIFFRRNPSSTRRHAPVHPVTEINAFHYAGRTTRVEETRRLMILQGAGWLPLLREDLIGLHGPMTEEGIDALGVTQEAPPPVEALFEEPSPAATRARLDLDPAAAGAYRAGLRSFLMTRANQNHQYKFLAAVEEESALIHPRWASRMLAPAVTYLPTARDPETETLRRSLHALERAGLGFRRATASTAPSR